MGLYDRLKKIENFFYDPLPFNPIQTGQHLVDEFLQFMSHKLWLWNKINDITSCIYNDGFWEASCQFRIQQDQVLFYNDQV